MSGHYSIDIIEDGMNVLKSIFPDGEANEMNFVLFSTSGIHGLCTTIEEIEHSLNKYGHEWPDHDPDDYRYNELTTLIIHPRLVKMVYGNIRVEIEDIAYLKKLRASSSKVASGIGFSISN